MEGVRRDRTAAKLYHGMKALDNPETAATVSLAEQAAAARAERRKRAEATEKDSIGSIIASSESHDFSDNSCCDLCSPRGEVKEAYHEPNLNFDDVIGQINLKL